MRLHLLAGVCAALVAGCETAPDDGAITAPGANPGIVIGSQVGAGAGEPPIGVVAGAVAAADIGHSLTETDRPIALQAEYEALEYGRAGQPVAWRNPDSGNRGVVTAGTTYEVNRLDCREYTHNVIIGGRTRVARATACRQPDGVWRVVG
jgi:surface antigen